MKTVGIVTFHNAHNFGAVLQCLALKTAIRNLGYEVEVIDHNNTCIINDYVNNFRINIKCGFYKILKSFANYCVTYFPKENRIRKFKRFINTYLLENRVTTKKSSNYYDCLVFGSDQIWCSSLTNDDVYYWGKTDLECNHKISYAASAGNFDDHIDKNLPLLNDFSSISVREKSLQEYLVKKGINAVVTIDPTLLIEAYQWINLLSLRKKSFKPYILVYAMRNKKKVRSLAKRVAKEKQLNTIEIHNKFIGYKDIAEKYNDGDPIDFLTLIYNAQYIITDSFHGTVFSIIFNKQFVTVKLNDGKDNRVQHLLKTLQLEERLSELGENYNNPINYTIVNSKLTLLRQDSMTFLEDALTASQYEK